MTSIVLTHTDTPECCNATSQFLVDKLNQTEATV